MENLLELDQLGSLWVARVYDEQLGRRHDGKV
jgi:hypothetical protein